VTNRLSQSSSAYLRSAAHQPIEWYEFGDAAFAQAKALDRPILLDIGAVWCHWCHVIDRESYENPEIAQLINDHYIAVKVDRDQRPDVDARYQQVVASMTGQGGWPLTAFLTHDGRVIYGGTYFPPHVMKQLLTKIHGVYHEKKADIFNAEPILTTERSSQTVAESAQSIDASVAPDFLETILASCTKNFDPTFGGFGNQPKFPHYSALQLLVTASFHNPEPHYRDLLNKTLEAMGRGGVHDQIAGGFHRYSVDTMWHVPHFEKLAYDNAEALVVYSQAYRLLNNRFFKDVAEGIVSWVMEELSDRKNGGFYASQDADIDLNDDGDHFTWTLSEVNALLTPEEAEVVSRYYDLTERGDMHERPGRNVLWVKVPLTQLAEHLLRPEAEITHLLTSAQKKMRAERKRRAKPFIDTTLYVNWNGMMIYGFLEAGTLLNLSHPSNFALKTLDRVIREYYTPEQGVLHAKGVPGFLEDYAWFILACLKAYQATSARRYLDVAQDCMETLLERFQDKTQGGFFDTAINPEAHGLLKLQRKPVEDSPSSSGNAIAIQGLLQLELITGESRYRDAAEKALQTFTYTYGKYGLYVGALGLAAHEYLNSPLRIELVGESNALRQQALLFFHPGKVIVHRPAENGSPPQARLCLGQRCLPPLIEGMDWQSVFPLPVKAFQ
jgi:uncharacterized protein YyaL (SSP411 family)